MTAREAPATARRRHKGHFERGAAAVEMALVMPLLILMVMGIIDFGRIFNGEIQLSQAAREGARVAALGYSVDDVIARTRAALNNPAFAQTPTFANSPTGCAQQTGCILVGVVPVGGGTASTNAVCVAGDATGGNSQVTVTIPYTKILWGPASLSQTAVMKCSG